MALTRRLRMFALRCACAAWVIAAHPAHARATRRYFEPTDLEMDDAGVLDLDLQFGILRDEPWRASAPDFEVDLGLAPGIELDIDSAYHVDGSAGGGWHDSQGSFDNLWLAAKLGVYDSRTPESARAWAFGMQLGPKLPIAAGARGAGYEALVLLSESWRGRRVVFNAGGFVDPGDGALSPRPRALEGGLDINVDTGARGLAVTGELGGAHFLSADDDQLHATAGLSWSVSDDLDVSVVGLVGFLRGGDRGGVLVGFSPKCTLWR